jgi:hypothetical protein
MFLRVMGCCALMLLASCGGERITKVTGTVKYKDKPAENATVIFTPVGGGITGAATTDANGVYSLSSTLGGGVRAGAYEVSIKSQAKPVAESNPMAGLEPGSPEYAEAYRAASSSSRDKKTYKTAVDPNAIPEKYSSSGTLKASVDVVATQTIDFTLE